MRSFTKTFNENDLHKAINSPPTPEMDFFLTVGSNFLEAKIQDTFLLLICLFGQLREL